MGLLTESARADCEMRLKREKLAGKLQLRLEEFLAEMAVKSGLGEDDAHASNENNNSQPTGSPR